MSVVHTRAVMTLYRQALQHTRSWKIDTVSVSRRPLAKLVPQPIECWWVKILAFSEAVGL